MKKPKTNVVKFIMPPRNEMIELIKNSFNWFTLDGKEGVLIAADWADDGYTFWEFDKFTDDDLHDIIECDDWNPVNIGNFPKEVVNHSGDKIVRIWRSVLELAEPKENQEVFC
jgi:hypothetical protein